MHRSRCIAVDADPVSLVLLKFLRVDVSQTLRAGSGAGYVYIFLKHFHLSQIMCWHDL